MVSITTELTHSLLETIQVLAAVPNHRGTLIKLDRRLVSLRDAINLGGKCWQDLRLLNHPTSTHKKKIPVPLTITRTLLRR